MKEQNKILSRRKDNQLYQQLKDKAREKYKKISNKKYKLKELEEILKIYDIDPVINYDYLNSLIESINNYDKNFRKVIINYNSLDLDDSYLEDDDKENEKDNKKKRNDECKSITGKEIITKYLQYINTLTTKDKKYIIQEIKNKNLTKFFKEYLNDKSNLESYFKILLLINKNKKGNNNISKIRKIFEEKYCIDNSIFKIPLIYGSNNLRYSWLIKDLYIFLFHSNIKVISNPQNYNIFNIIKEYPKDIIIKKNNDDDMETNYNDKNYNDKNYTNLKNDNNNINNGDIFNNIINIDEQIDSENQNIENNSIETKINFLNYFLNRILGKEFMNIFKVKEKYKYDDYKFFEEENYILNPDVSSLFFHLLYLHLIMYSFIYFPEKTLQKKASILKYFFEEKRTKISIMNFIKYNIKSKIIDGEEIELKTQKKIECEDTEYKFKIDDDEFFFNPYNYIMDNTYNFNSQYFKSDIKNPENYSLYKNYRDSIDNNKNKMFINYEIYNSFKSNIYEMLKSNVINEVFHQFNNYKLFNNPFKSKKCEEIIDLIDKITFYCKFPISQIDGLTFKDLGVILINTKKNNNTFSDGRNKFKIAICSISYKKITQLHEILSHYLSTLLRSNSKKVNLITPSKIFKNYTSTDESFLSKYDGGDKVESLLFGNKIKYLTIQASLFILDNNSWNNLTLEEFRTKFIELNKIATFNLDLEKEKMRNNNQLFINLIKHANLQSIKIISFTKKNSFCSFKLNSGSNEEDNDNSIAIFDGYSLTRNEFIKFQNKLK